MTSCGFPPRPEITLPVPRQGVQIRRASSAVALTTLTIPAGARSAPKRRAPRGGSHRPISVRRARSGLASDRVSRTSPAARALVDGGDSSRAQRLAAAELSRLAAAMSTLNRLRPRWFGPERSAIVRVGLGGDCLLVEQHARRKRRHSRHPRPRGHGLSVGGATPRGVSGKGASPMLNAPPPRGA